MSQRAIARAVTAACIALGAQLATVDADAQRRPPCAEGRVSNSDTAGRCCWPGQAWSRSRQQCVGTPDCPRGTALQGAECVVVAPPPPTCPAGQVVSPDTAGHCCWPAQVWSTSREVCVGVPECPAGMAAEGGACVVRLPPCPEGRARSADTAGQCCWPGQVWSASRGVCVGVPACPPGLAASGETCVAPQPAAPVCEGGREATVDTRGHCCWPGQVWSVVRGACAGVPSCPAGASAINEECVAAPPPVAACPAGQLASADTAGHCCWPGQAWSVMRSACVGAPSCPMGSVAVGEQCATPNVTAVATPNITAVATPNVTPAPEAPAAGAPSGPPPFRIPLSILLDYWDNGLASVSGRFPIRLARVGTGALALAVEIGFAVALPQPPSGSLLGIPLALTFGYALPLGTHQLFVHGGLATLTLASSYGQGRTSWDMGFFGRTGASFTVAINGTPRIPLGFDINFGQGGVGFRGLLGVAF